MLERWTRAVIRFRFAVLACWLVLAAAGIISSVRLPALLSTSLAVPGTSSQVADATLARHFGENPEGTFTLVFRTRRVSPRTTQFLSRRVAAAARIVPGARARPLQSAAGILYGDIVTRLDLQHAAGYTDDLRRALSAHGLAADVTGPPALQHDLNPILAADLEKGETIAVPIALLILAAVLGLRGVLLVPVIFAGTTITTALAIVYVLAHFLLMVSYVPNLVELMGLGLAIDYSLLIVHRFREEAADEARGIDDAIARTMSTAGRAVLFSGAAVAIGLSAVLIVPVPFIRSMGVAGVIVPLVSMVAALTVQPALLSLLGRAGLQGASLLGMGGTHGSDRGAWAALARAVIRHRLAVLAGSSLVLVALAAPVLWLSLTPGSISSIPLAAPSARGLALLTARVGAGTITPIDVVIDTAGRGQARSPVASAATLSLGRRLLMDPEVFVVQIGPKPPYMDTTGRYRRIVVTPRHEFGAEATQNLVKRLRSRYIPATHFPRGWHISSGGAPAQGIDFLDRVYSAFPFVILVALALAYLVLLRAFRSVVLPLVSLLLDLISVAAACGLLVVIFQLGVGGSLLGSYRNAQIEGWIPVFLFATLFGLSMDYQVFLVTRMRESWDRGADGPTAVAYGLERTGRIVSAAALIMVVSFAGFMVGRVAGLQEFGTGLALGVLLDATLVRILLMPSLIVLLGPWSWWLPVGVARLMRVEASPLTRREGRGLWKSA